MTLYRPHIPQCKAYLDRMHANRLTPQNGVWSASGLSVLPQSHPVFCARQQTGGEARPRALLHSSPWCQPCRDHALRVAVSRAAAISPVKGVDTSAPPGRKRLGARLADRAAAEGDGIGSAETATAKHGAARPNP